MYRIYNLLSSIPNDDDLKEVYSSERASLVAEHTSQLKRRRQELKLGLVQDCLWKGWVGIRRQAGKAIVLPHVASLSQSRAASSS